MSQVFTDHRRVEFAHTDAAGIAHFSAYCCYMEQVEHAFWRQMGTSVVERDADGLHLSWPRVRVECDFSGTAKFEDVLKIDARVLRLGAKSVTFGFDFSLDESPIARGKIVAVCCQFQLGEPLQSIPIPEHLRSKLAPFVAEAE